VLTTPETWKTWYGGELCAVHPTWQQGAELKWDSGSSKISEFTPLVLLGFGDFSVKSLISLSDGAEGSTIVTYSETVGGHLSVSNPSAKQAQCDSTVRDLKKYSENSNNNGIVESLNETVVGIKEPLANRVVSKKKFLWLIAGASLILLFSVFVWPTRNKSEPSLYFFQGVRKMRSDRFNGSLQMKFDNGWRDIIIQQIDNNYAIIKFDGSDFKIPIENVQKEWLHVSDKNK